MVSSYEYASLDWYVNAFFEYSGLDATISDFNEGYAIWLKQQLNYAGITVGRAFSHGFAALGVSRLFSDDVLENVTKSPFSNSLIGYHARGQFRLGFFALSGAINRFTDHCSVSGIQQLKDVGIRTFPLYLSNWQYSGAVATGWKNGEVKVSGSVKYSSSKNLINSTNALTNNLVAIMRRGEITGSHKIKNVVVLCKGWLEQGGGYLEGFDSKNYNYMLMDTLTLVSMGVQAGLTGWNGISAGFYGDNWNGQSPYGFISMAPFSNWALFYPLKYRFLNTNIRFSETGVYVEKKHSFGPHHSIDGRITGSYLSGTFYGTRQQRTIAVFIPYYTNTIEYSNFRIRGTLLSAMAGYSLTIAKFSLTATVKQYIPFIKNQNPEANTAPSPPNPGEGPEIQSVVSEKTAGGTLFGLDVGVTF